MKPKIHIISTPPTFSYFHSRSQEIISLKTYYRDQLINIHEMKHMMVVSRSMQIKRVHWCDVENTINLARKLYHVI